MITIPPMTHPDSRAWEQPPLTEILLDDQHAAMTRATLAALPEYSASIPTGVYEGKMWRRKIGPGADDWMLCWYVDVHRPGNLPPTHCAVWSRPILIVGWIERGRRVESARIVGQ